MQFRDLKRQYEVLKEEIDSAVLEVMTEGNFISGRQVKELEAQLAEYVGVKHCITCANGTDALELALMAMNVKETDAVFVPDFTFFASGEAPANLGAVPVFVDVDETTFNISPVALEKAIEDVLAEGRYTPKVIITVDLFGLPADYDKIRVIADKYHLLILEDGAQGFGGALHGKRACSFGDISTTSFFPAKPLGCYGDGGAIFTDNDTYAELLRSYAIHGKGTDKYDNIRLGMNSRLDTIQAVVLKIKLKAFVERELDAVNKAATLYTEELKGVVSTPIIPEGFYSSWAQYTIRLETPELRDSVQQALKAEGIPSMVYYPKMMHRQTAFQSVEMVCEAGSCSVAEKLCGCVLQLPIHPYIKEKEVKQVCAIVKAAIQK